MPISQVSRVRKSLLAMGILAIGLDLFLGADAKFYTAQAITEVYPHYISRRFTPDYIVPRVVEVIAREDMFPENDQDKSLFQKWFITVKYCTSWI